MIKVRKKILQGVFHLTYYIGIQLFLYSGILKVIRYEVMKEFVNFKQTLYYIKC